MTTQTSATPNYTSGFSDQYTRYLMRHTAESSAAYLFPYLRPGLRVLDFGCGPGSISVGLAKIIEPGELHGIDMEESQIELAKSLSEDSGCENAIFQVGDVTALPFEDGFFDVAHCHNVLSYVPDTRAALAEVKRTLKPGGVLGCSELIIESSFIHPQLGILKSAWDIFEDLLESDDGHPQMGKDMKEHILGEGFTDIQVNASFEIYSNPSEMDFVYNFFKSWFLSPEISEAAIKYGAATRELYDEINVTLDEWKDHPGALVGLALGEATATRP